jgi:hypothetical protein
MFNILKTKKVWEIQKYIIFIKLIFTLIVSKFLVLFSVAYIFFSYYEVMNTIKQTAYNLYGMHQKLKILFLNWKFIKIKLFSNYVLICYSLVTYSINYLFIFIYKYFMSVLMEYILQLQTNSFSLFLISINVFIQEWIIVLIFHITNESCRYRYLHTILLFPLKCSVLKVRTKSGVYTFEIWLFYLPPSLYTPYARITSLLYWIQ